MSGQWPGVHSTQKVPTKKNEPQKVEAEIKPLEKKGDILVKIYNVQESFNKEQAKQHTNTIHTDQTGKFPHAFSGFHKYQMVF